VIAIFCILGSAAGFFLSLNHGAIWPLAWIAPIPVLWLSFGQINRWLAFLSAWAAYALGSTNVLIAYAREMPIPILILATCAPALYFALTTTLARQVAKRISPLAGAIAFGAIWTACDYLVSFLHDGTAPSPAYSQVGAPVLIQSASLFGLWVITFLLGFVPAALALSLRERNAAPAVVAVLALALNLGYGEWRLVYGRDGAAVRIGLGSDDSISARATAGHPERAADAAARYGAAAETLAHNGATLIVFPEKIARLSAAGRDAVIRILRAAAAKARVSIVIGFDDRSAEPRNEAFVFSPDGAEPQVYFKRHFVRGLEDIFVPGDRVLSIGAKTDVEICKDMDYPRMLRADSRAQHPSLLLVPAWDFAPMAGGTRGLPSCAELKTDSPSRAPRRTDFSL
jgi:apolipoprotein N-acyltransferase